MGKPQVGILAGRGRVKTFLSNGANKERLFQLIEDQVWAENAHKFGERVIYFARKNLCRKLNRDGSVNVE